MIQPNANTVIAKKIEIVRVMKLLLFAHSAFTLILIFFNKTKYFYTYHMQSSLVSWSHSKLFKQVVTLKFFADSSYRKSMLNGQGNIVQH